MPSVFDDARFNERLFFPRPDATGPSPGSRDVYVPVAPGVSLHARVHEAGDPRAALLLFHGNGEVVSDYDGLSRELTRAGVSMGVVDYRGYGRSTGSPTLRCALGDVRAVLEALVPELTRGGLPLVVQGRSLGGLSAAEAVRVGVSMGVRGYVFESSPSDLAGLVRRRGLTPPDAFSEEERRVFDPREKLRAYEGPLLVLHGARDTLIHPDEGRALYEAAARADRSLVLVPERGHNDVMLDPAYWSALRAFVERVARG